MDEIEKFLIKFPKYQSCISFFTSRSLMNIQEITDTLPNLALDFVEEFDKLISLKELKYDLKVFKEEHDSYLKEFSNGHDRCLCNELKERVVSLEEKFKHLNELVIRYVRSGVHQNPEVPTKSEVLTNSEVQTNPDVRTNSEVCLNSEVLQTLTVKNFGDHILENKWLIRACDLDAAVRNTSSCNFTGLVKVVFGEHYIKRFNSYATLPRDVKQACDKLIEIFANAKLVTTNGCDPSFVSISAMKRDLKQRLGKFLNNNKFYKLRKERKSLLKQEPSIEENVIKDTIVGKKVFEEEAGKGEMIIEQEEAYEEYATTTRTRYINQYNGNPQTY